MCQVLRHQGCPPKNSKPMIKELLWAVVLVNVHPPVQWQKTRGGKVIDNVPRIGIKVDNKSAQSLDKFCPLMLDFKKVQEPSKL